MSHKTKLIQGHVGKLPFSDEPKTVMTHSRLECYRLIAMKLASQIGSADSNERAAMLIYLRNIQDEIARLKFRHQGQSSQPAWIDEWSPGT